MTLIQKLAAALFAGAFAVGIGFVRSKRIRHRFAAA
jgi:hypothetical protein